MINKNVCPKCGQLFDLNLAACPVCGTPAQVAAEAEQQPVQRRRLTETERRQRQQEQKREAAEQRRREREQRRAADAEEERELEEEEERLRQQRQRQRMEKRGMSQEQIERRLNPEQTPEPVQSIRPFRRQSRVPAAFSVVSILLLLAALAIGGSYLLWNYGLLDVALYDKLSGTAQAEQSADAVCQAITLATDRIEFAQAAGESFALEYTLLPADCKLPVTFSTSNEGVAMVGELGIVTAVAPGTATITVRCGEASASCTVDCTFTPEQSASVPSVDLSDGLQLSMTDITFSNPNESVYLSVTNLPADTAVFWQSSDESIATVEPNGHVVAVGPGTCYVTAVVDSYPATCTVRCNFSDEG